MHSHVVGGGSRIILAWPTPQDIKAACPESQVPCPYYIEVDTGGRCDQSCAETFPPGAVVKGSCIDAKTKH